MDFGLFTTWNAVYAGDKIPWDPDYRGGKLLEKEGLDVIPLRVRHSKLLGGGPHCVTLDVRRNGTLQRYFD